MKIKDLGLNSDSETEITSLAFNTRFVKEGALFFCLLGKENDGHTFAQEALNRGARAIVVERNLAIDCEQIVCDDTRLALSVASQAFYANPSRKLKLVGVTGTNGKTTTTYILKSILEAAGKPCGVIGTTAISYNGNSFPSNLTTPDPIELNRILADMLSAGVEYVVMEASAHAIALRKLDGIMFDVAAFTNLSRDHLDFFETMDKYAEVKRSFFSPLHARRAVVNVDDELGRDIALRTKLPVTTFGVDNPADVFGIDLNMSVMGLTYVINMFDQVGEIKFNLTGRFNMYNTLCAAAIAHELDIGFKDIVRGIRNLKKVDGRFDIINTTKCNVIIDFAHTDDGLRNILNSIREFAPQKIITVFGCGGNRDKTKRPIMGRVVAELSDYCVLTSDNPRYEPPLEIIRQIEEGITATHRDNYCIIVDREEAIKYAIEMANTDDIVLIAGKGAEKYQEVMGKKREYNDEKFVMELSKEYNF